ncbi:MAG: hypothetical protein WC989_09825 [Micavibrio sp.]
MKIFASVLFSLVLVMAAFSPAAAAAQESHFRGMIWGAGKEDVRRYEKALFDREENGRLYFLEQPDKYRRLIVYEFKDGELWRGQSAYRELHDPSPQAILDLFAQRQVALEQELGPPLHEEMVWKNGRYRYYPQFWGRALRDGDLRIRAVWEKEDSRIWLEVGHDGMFYELLHGAEQKSIAALKENIPLLLLNNME